MNKLSNDIYQYYLAHWTDLPADKQFHFASRLWLWDGDATMHAKLGDLQSYYLPDASPERALKEVYQLTAGSPVHGSKNAAQLRRPYFERYPNLKLVVSLLFRANFIETIYGIDCRPSLHHYLLDAKADELYQQLLHDKQATAILSTHAINFFYLYDRFVRRDETGLPLQWLYDVGQTGYDQTDALQLQLLVYLYTHCIIGESRFYSRSLPANTLPLYQSMVAYLEQIIHDHFPRINLDNKCEFLVCAELAGVSSGLQQRITDEAARSVAPDGTFIIDRHNANPQRANVDLAGSEHRNVLYIMANRPRAAAGLQP